MIINHQDIASLISLSTHAYTHLFTKEQVQEFMNGKTPVPGDTPEFARRLSGGCKVVLTIEMQDPFIIRHLSVSLPESLPPQFIVAQIMGLTGFQFRLGDPEIMFEPEHLGDKHYVINVLEQAPFILKENKES